MRKLMWLAMGFAGGIFGALSIWTGLHQLPVFICMSVLLVVFVLISVRYRIYRLLIPVLIGVGFGALTIVLWRVIYWNPLYKLDSVTTHAAIEACDYSEPSTYGYQVSGKVSYEGRIYRAVVYMDSDADVKPGDVLAGTFRFRTTIPLGQKDNEYYRSNGILLLASARKDVQIIKADKIPARYFANVLSHRAKEVMERIFPSDVLPFAKSLMLGDTTDLDYATDTALKVSGIRHIVAVSGLHVSILYAIVFALVGHRRVPCLILGTPIMILFAACAGFSPSVTRACIVIILMMLAEALQMEYDPLTELSFAITAMLAFNPFMIESVSFQLSVCSVLGIILCSGKIRVYLNNKMHCAHGKDRKNRALRWINTSISVTVGAMVFTIPLSLIYFDTVCLVGIVTNLLIIWMVGAIFTGVLLSTLCGFVSLGAGAIAASVTAVPIRTVLFAAGQISRIPYACVYARNPCTAVWVCMCYCALIYYLIFRRKKMLLISSCVLALLVTIFIGAYRPWTDEFRLSVVDVGQGQSILLQSKGHTVVVDCGSTNLKTAADRTAQTLLSQSIFGVDGIIVTHMDSDHSGSIENLLTRIDAKTVYLPQLEGDWRDNRLADALDTDIVCVDSSITFPLGDARVTIIKTPEVKTSNENSLGVLFESDECAILITGDRNRSGEKALIRTGLLKDVDVLVAGHHGSKNATSDELLDAVTPEILMISAGKDNSYGHPAQQVLERGLAHGCRIQRTDESGTLLYRR